MNTEKSYFKELGSMLQQKRDLMAKLLREVGFKPTIPEGGYFMMADTSDIGKKYNLMEDNFQHHIYFFFIRGSQGLTEMSFFVISN